MYNRVLPPHRPVPRLEVAERDILACRLPPFGQGGRRLAGILCLPSREFSLYALCVCLAFGWDVADRFQGGDLGPHGANLVENG